MTTVEALAAGSGLLLTLALGRFCGLFLERTVTVKLPSRFEVYRVPAETAGGGKQLGTLERVLFFASLWGSAYAFIVGWLAFKVAAKWAAWQHVTKLPEAKDETLEDHLKLSSRLLGRFMNGVIYNIFCAGIGAVFAKILPSFSGSLPGNLWYWAVGINIVAGLVLIWSLFALTLSDVQSWLPRKVRRALRLDSRNSPKGN